MRITLLFLLALANFCTGVMAQQARTRSSHLVSWYPLQKVFDANGTSTDWMICENCIGSAKEKKVPYLPVFIRDLKVASPKVVNASWVSVPFWELRGLDTAAAKLAPATKIELGEQNRRAGSTVQVLLVRNVNGNWERLQKFDLEATGTSYTETEKSGFRTAVVQNSMFRTGNWAKIGVTKTGIYQLTVSDLTAAGLEIAGKNSNQIRMYGTGGKMLSEANRTYTFGDIPEIGIQVEDGGDGIFNNNDRILFYGEEPNGWFINQNTRSYQFQRNIYSDSTFYFVTVSDGTGKRIQSQPSGNEVDVTVTTYPERYVYAPENVNVLGAGREWYADVLDFTTTKDINFPVSNLACDSIARFRIGVMGRSQVSYPFIVKVNGTQLGGPMTMATTPMSSLATYGYDSFKIENQKLNCGTNNVGINIAYNKQGNQQSIGYVNFVEMTAIRNLSWAGENMGFRSFAFPGKHVLYSVGNLPANVRIWNVTRPLNTTQIQLSGSAFSLFQDTAQEFYAFADNLVAKPASISALPNQDLQGLPVVDMVIVAPRRFLIEANRLADFRRQHDGLEVAVVELSKVYNEFSCGAQDVTAIRNLAMHQFYKDENKKLRYLLLFGDCSYDYKDRISNNTNFVPTYEGNPSLNIISSYSSDDYFGILNRTKGSWGGDDLMDIGVGRLPAKSVEEAAVMVNKLIHYSGNPASLGNWRSRFTFVADDGDRCLHSSDADSLSDRVAQAFPDAVINKIYLGAYEQVANPGGFTSPDCTGDLINIIEKGSLVVNYTGHGGETVWGDEFLFTNDMIAGLRNYDRLAFFITATCDFGRNDYPAQVSGAESLLLNPQGGAIGIVTTGRPVNAYSNFVINNSFYQAMLTNRVAFTGRMGDVMMKGKNISPYKDSNRGFILLGDPSQKFALPEEEVVVTEMNTDSIKGLDQIRISGEIRNDGTLDGDFNGKIFATVFDRPNRISLDDNEPGFSHCKTNYPYFKNVLYNGSVKVNEGKYQFNFFVSKDISYQIGAGKMSLYAMDEIRLKDASGNKLNIPVGGLNPNPITDDEGPIIKPYMNDVSFLTYGLVGTDANLLVFLEDSSGINTSGLGLGHDLTATLDGNTVYNLNSYFENEEGSYKKGNLRFPLRSLAVGLHSITIKAWDNFNNSSSSTIWFEVGASAVNGIIAKAVNLYPNPFAEEIYISLENAYAGENVQISLTVFDIQGKEIAGKTWDYKNSIARPGAFNELAWDSRNADGTLLPAGTYFCKIGLKSDTDGAEYKINKKIVLIR